jgi:hypothetical protein
MSCSAAQYWSRTWLEMILLNKAQCWTWEISSTEGMPGSCCDPPGGDGTAIVQCSPYWLRRRPATPQVGVVLIQGLSCEGLHQCIPTCTGNLVQFGHTIENETPKKVEVCVNVASPVCVQGSPTSLSRQLCPPTGRWRSDALLWEVQTSEESANIRHLQATNAGSHELFLSLLMRGLCRPGDGISSRYSGRGRNR